MYSAAAKARRCCTAVRADGEPCEAYALWEFDTQVCAAHSGRPRRTHHARRSVLTVEQAFALMYGRDMERTRVPPCRCQAYNWPHRPGGGLCNWPDSPAYCLTTPAGTRRYSIRARRPRVR